MDLNKTDTTRYLCAAAHFDKAFRDLVLEQLVEEEYKAITVSHGVDLLTVVKHCLAARRREFIRDCLLASWFLIGILVDLTLGSIYSFPFFIVACGIVFWVKWRVRYIIGAQYLNKKNFNPHFIKVKTNQNLEVKLEQIQKNQQGNIIVYGGFSPFVGSGYDIGGWSFALNLNNHKEGIGETLSLIPFEVQELYDYVVSTIRELELPGLTIEDKLCVNGQEIRGNTNFLSDPLSRPYSQVEPGFLKKFVNQNTKHIRYYKKIKIISWNGEFIISIFLRFIKIKQKLFIEASYFILTPVKSEYQEVDSIDLGITVQKVLRVLGSSVLSTIIIWPISVFRILFKIIEPFCSWRKRRKMRKIIKETPNFNYGAVTSLREEASSPVYTQYFQKLDKEMYIKIIERQMIDSIVDFLDSKNIDTSDLKERRSEILNNGIIVSGGSIKATNLSVGKEAKINS